MQLADMTIPEKSRWMAEKMEPLSATSKADGWPVSWDYEKNLSPKGFWTKTYMKSPDGYYRHEAVARDMTDPDMTIMLMEELISKPYWVERREDGVMFQRVNAASSRFSATIGEAVLDAAMLAEGFVEA